MIPKSLHEKGVNSPRPVNRQRGKRRRPHHYGAASVLRLVLGFLGEGDLNALRIEGASLSTVTRGVKGSGAEVFPSGVVETL
jgi:hypothetical protein